MPPSATSTFPTYRYKSSLWFFFMNPICFYFLCLTSDHKQQNDLLTCVQDICYMEKVSRLFRNTYKRPPLEYHKYVIL